MTTTDQATRVTHLTLALSELAKGNDLLETPTRDGGIILKDDEADLFEMIMEIALDVVPNYYANNWVRFLMDYTQALANAGQDMAEAKADGEVLPDSYLTDYIRLFIDKIYEAGRKMVN
jgi:hypothetical protein